MDTFDFDYQKATQALNFFAIKEGGAIEKLKVIKLIWLVDRLHLRKYGRPIVNDTYFAMKLGPVCSSVKDIADMSDYLDEREREYAVRFLEVSVPNVVKSIGGVDEQVFSKSELELLDMVFQAFGKKSAYEMVEFSHNFPEWKKHEDGLKVGTRAKMRYLDFFESPVGFSDPLEVSQDELQASKEIFEEAKDFDRLWD